MVEVEDGVLLVWAESIKEKVYGSEKVVLIEFYLHNLYFFEERKEDWHDWGVDLLEVQSIPGYTLFSTVCQMLKYFFKCQFLSLFI